MYNLTFFWGGGSPRYAMNKGIQIFFRCPVLGAGVNSLIL